MISADVNLIKYNLSLWYFLLSHRLEGLNASALVSLTRVSRFCDLRNQHKIKTQTNKQAIFSEACTFSKLQQIFRRFMPRCIKWRPHIMHLAKALFESCASNRSTAIRESNYICDFPDSNLKAETYKK